jgi:ATP-dependent helicase/nuclease subunit A
LLEFVNYADIAILLRTRTRLKEFEDALRRYDIPFVVAGGIGFYQQQEIYDLVNLLRILVDYRQDIALAGVLRSPLFSFSDDQLLYVALGNGSAWIGKSKLSPLDLPIQREQGQEASKEARFLWEKLEHHARSIEKIPEELNPPKFLHTYKLLSSWKSQANRIPITHLLRHILEDTGLYGILSGDRREVQSLINIEKLLDIARTFEDAGFQTLSDFVSYLDLLIELEEREGEAQINFEGMDAVRLMTIHAAKGLEFPVVFVPELDRPFNYGTSDSIYIDTIKSGNGDLPAIGIKGLNPDQNYASENTVLRNYLKWVSEEKTDAEMKRLLYVGCTRAEDHLVLSGTLSKKVSKNSWMTWLLKILPLEDSISQQHFTISENTENPQEIRELEILIHTSEEYGKRLHPPSPPQGGNRSGDLAKSPLEGGQGGVSQNLDIYQTLRQNLTPIRGHENESFRINPSTLHTLFQCPRKYYYQHILRLPEPILEEHPPTPLEGGIGKDRGTIIHKAFEERLFDENKSEEELLASFTRFLDKMNISEQERSVMQLHSAIKRAYESYTSSGIKALLASSPKVYREYPFQMRTGRIYMSGTIDVLFFDPHHEMWTILDYKSNEIPAEQIVEEIQRHGYDIQMQLYTLAVSRLLHVDHIRSILLFTFPGCVYDAVDLSSNTLKALEKRITAFLEQLSEGTIDVSQKQLACEECEYRFYEAC